MKITIARSLFVFGGVVTSGLLTSTAIQNYTLGNLKVNGPEYTEIVYGKDLVADILPPPLYVIEPYMLATEGFYHDERRAVDIQKALALKSVYEERRAYWVKSGLQTGLKSELADEVETTGDSFWNVFDNNVVPASKTDDKAKQMAALDKLSDAFYVHQAAVLKLVDSATKFQANAESHARYETERLSLLAAGSAAISILLFLAGIVFFRRRAIGPLSGMTAYMSNLASGDYSKQVPFTTRTDEIGEMSKAVEIFRGNVLERQKARKADEDRRHMDLERERALAQERAEEDGRRRDVIAQLTGGLEQLSAGNLSHRINKPFAEAYEKLRTEFNLSVATLAQSMEEITSAAGSVRNSSSEIASSTGDLARRTEQQAATIEETASALEEITATVKNSTERANEASKMMNLTRTGAEKSASVVQDAIHAMERIAESSSEISQIINVIDEIAFQTNLLALNAGVEAARAGDAGKGFAVVAQEVRELASRSAKAAKEIKALIETSSSQVQNGVSLVNRTGDALSEIGSQIVKVNSLISDIVTAASEQATAIGEINHAVNHMDQVTQQNASMAEETNTACLGLRQEAETLEGVVTRFKISDVSLNRIASDRNPSVRRVPQPIPTRAPITTAKKAVHNPAPSPARALGSKIASAFGIGKPNSPTQAADWEEF
jgi:methyl-accepting chemotaxis protein